MTREQKNMTQDGFSEIFFKTNLKLHIERAHHILETINPEQSTSRHNLVKLLDF